MANCDIFDSVEEQGAKLPPHVKLMLKKMGITSALGLSAVTEDDLHRIESTVRTVFASKKRKEIMTETDKLAVFGDFFVDDPDNFQFLPGEKIEIFVAVNIAKKMIEPKSLSGHESKKRKRNQEGLLGASASKVPRRTLEGYIANWFENTKMTLRCSVSDFSVIAESNSVQCKLCPTLNPIRIRLDSNGNWNADIFQKHIKRFHCVTSADEPSSNSDRRNIIVDKTGTQKNSLVYKYCL